jgi:hypothetical protein
LGELTPIQPPYYGFYQGGIIMTELREKLQQGQNALSKLINKIPGFSGYISREQSRDADKIQRTFMAKSVRDERNRLQDLGGEALRSGNMAIIAEIDRISKLFDKVIDRIEHAEYGYSGLFSATKVDTQELDNLYEYDLGMLNNIASISEGIAAFEASLNSDELDPKRKLKDLENSLKELDRKIDGRQKLLKGVE